MSAILLTAPALEPISLEETKAYLRVEHSDDDVIAADTGVARRIRHLDGLADVALVPRPQRREDRQHSGE